MRRKPSLFAVVAAIVEHQFNPRVLIALVGCALVLLLASLFGCALKSKPSDIQTSADISPIWLDLVPPIYKGCAAVGWFVNPQTEPDSYMRLSCSNGAGVKPTLVDLHTINGKVVVRKTHKP